MATPNAGRSERPRSDDSNLEMLAYPPPGIDQQADTSASASAPGLSSSSKSRENPRRPSHERQHSRGILGGKKDSSSRRPHQEVDFANDAMGGTAVLRPQYRSSKTTLTFVSQQSQQQQQQQPQSPAATSSTSVTQHNNQQQHQHQQEPYEIEPLPTPRGVTADPQSVRFSGETKTGSAAAGATSGSTRHGRQSGASSTTTTKAGTMGMRTKDGKVLNGCGMRVPVCGCGWYDFGCFGGYSPSKKDGERGERR